MSQQFGMSEAIELMYRAMSVRVKRLRYEGFEVEFFEDKAVIENKPNVLEEMFETEDDKMPTEDELLYWSIPHEPDIHAHPPKE
jgi:hypothetical protein